MDPKSHFPTWLGGLLILVTAMVAGGGVYLITKAQHEMTTAELERQIEDLSARLGQKNDNGTPKPANMVFDEDAFTLSAPSGWTKDAKTRIGHDGDPSFHYKDGEGNFFEVWMDAQGSGYSADASWGYVVNADGETITVKTEGEQCTEASDFCEAGDNKLHIWLLSDKPGETKVKGHSYHFVFGNETKESGVALDVFRDIIKSFKAN